MTHVNGWFPAVYKSYMRQNFRLLLESNLPVVNFRICPLMYPRPLTRLSEGNQRASAGCIPSLLSPQIVPPYCCVIDNNGGNGEPSEERADTQSAGFGVKSHY